MGTLLKQAETQSEESAGRPFRPVVTVVVSVLTVTRGELAVFLSPLPSGLWELPRGVPRQDEALDETAQREVTRSVGGGGYLEQLYTWGDPGADERERVLEVAYLSLAAAPRSPRVGAPGVEEPSWWPFSALPRLAPGHGRILEFARDQLRRRLAHTNLAWSLLPPEFSLSDLQQVYEVVQGRSLDKRNFRKWILGNGLLEPTAHERRDGAHRPARLYRFISRELRQWE
jgi:8-oxo-dGTP diphosphatase